jgi:hypothetical protein
MENTEMTIKECVEHIVQVLKEHKIKDKDIEIYDEDTVYFKYGDTEYQVLVEGPDTVNYGITNITGVGLDSDFWMYKDDNGDYLYIEEYLFNTVLEKRYSYVKKIWTSLEKLENIDNEDDLLQIVASYFGLTE